MATTKDALVSLRPTSEWIMEGDDYATLRWFDAVQSKPTLAEVTNEISVLDAAAATEQARLADVRADSNLQQLLTQAKTATVGQIDIWIANNVTTLAQARTVLAAIIKYIATKEG